MQLILPTGESMATERNRRGVKPLVVIRDEKQTYIGHAVCKDNDSKHAFDAFMACIFATNDQMAGLIRDLYYCSGWTKCDYCGQLDENGVCQLFIDERVAALGLDGGKG